MTWYASHIYAQATPTVQSIFATHPVFAKGLYHVNHLEGYQWPGAPESRWWLPHGLPPSGLLIVRELCPSSGEEFVWQRGKSLDWDSADLFSPEQAAKFAKYPVIHLDQLPSSEFGHLYYDSQWAGVHPPDRLLQFLKHVSVTTGTVIVFYHHASGAERAADQEWVWVFGEADCVYVAHRPEPYQVSRIMHTGDTHILGKQPKKQTVIQHVLSHFGLDLPSTYFALHTRGFPWSQYKV